VGDNLQGPTRKASGAIAGLVRARYRFLDGIFHPYVHVNIGGGQIRHALDVSSAGTDARPLVDRYTAETYNGRPNDMPPIPGAKDPRANDASLTEAQREAARGNIDPAVGANQTVCSNQQNCVDTIALGYLLVGGGVGIWLDVHKNVGLILDVNLLGAIGIAGSHSGMNIDVQIGAGAHF
jgi:hypothetical protein